MRIHGQYAPDHFVIPRRKRFERDAQLRAVSANRGLAGGHRRALLVPHLDRAEGSELSALGQKQTFCGALAMSALCQ
jgi:hypothetical protein